MTQLMAASPGASAPVDAESAADLAARIHVPRRLPIRYDGQPMRHLSNSSYTRFLLCPEDWRRWYLKGQRPAPTGAMFLGSRVDDALTLYYRRQLEQGESLSLEQVSDGYRDRWHAELAAANDERGVDWDEGLDEARAFELGLDALALTFSELVPQPRARRRGAAQAGVRTHARPRVDDPVLPGPRDRTPRRARQVGPGGHRLQGQDHHDHPGQGRLRPAGRAVPRRALAGGQPAREFCFAQIAKPGARRKQMAAALITTTRTVGQQRASLARIAQAASQIAAYHERFGPDAPWGFADPAGWKCAPRYCAHWHACPGGSGL